MYGCPKWIKKALIFDWIPVKIFYDKVFAVWIISAFKLILKKTICIRIHIRICWITTRTFLRNTNLLKFQINLKNSFLFSLISLGLSISLQISSFSIRPSNISSSILCKSDIFSARVFSADSNLSTLLSSNKQLTELIIFITKQRWLTICLMVFWLAVIPLLTNQDKTEWKWNTGDKCFQNDVEFGIKQLLQTRTSQPQTGQNNHVIKTFSLIIFAEEF